MYLGGTTEMWQASDKSASSNKQQATIVATNMLRVLRQAVKAGLRPPNWMQSLHSPYSYDMIVRRLSSDINPEAYFNRTHRQEANPRGERVDIHDIGGPDPKDYDILISDVDDEKLRHEITEIVGIPYHTVAKKEDAKKVVEVGDCYLYGPSYRTIFPTVVAREGRAHWVFFIADCGAPMTYLSAQVNLLVSVEKEAC